MADLKLLAGTMTRPKPKPPKPGKPRWRAGWYEIRRSLATFAVSITSGVAAISTSDNISAVAHKPGTFAAGIAAIMALVHFLVLWRTDNTNKR